ncbi:MAG: hypothetical protein KDD94_01020 [Calditrichaeota bacterium]|nr:hypothetical protein [Calditrichota bacterium]
MTDLAKRFLIAVICSLMLISCSVAGLISGIAADNHRQLRRVREELATLQRGDSLTLSIGRSKWTVMLLSFDNDQVTISSGSDSLSIILDDIDSLNGAAKDYRHALILTVSGLIIDNIGKHLRFID